MGVKGRLIRSVERKVGNTVGIRVQILVIEFIANEVEEPVSNLAEWSVGDSVDDALKDELYES